MTVWYVRLTLKTMEFKVSELEREPIEFDLELAPGAVDLGEEAEQVGPFFGRPAQDRVISHLDARR